MFTATITSPQAPPETLSAPTERERWAMLRRWAEVNVDDFAHQLEAGMIPDLSTILDAIDEAGFSVTFKTV